MFKRTYYVQRAERRNEGERVLRDTSFSSFICILFIFALCTWFIAIAFHWKAIFSEETKEIEEIIQDPQDPEFEIMIIHPRGSNEHNLNPDIRKDNMKHALQWNEDDEDRRTWAVEIIPTTETAIMTEASEMPTETILSTVLSTGTNKVQETDTSTSTSTLDLTESTIDLTESTRSTTDAPELSTSETTDLVSSEATIGLTTATTPYYATEPTVSFDINDNTETTSNWLFARRTETVTEIAETSTTEDTLTAESRNKDHRTTDWKRDTETGSTDLIDLDVTETDNFWFTTRFKGKLQSRTEREILTTTTEASKKMAAALVMATTDVDTDTEMTTLTVRPAVVINELSKVKGPQFMRNFGKGEGAIVSRDDHDEVDDITESDNDYY